MTTPRETILVERRMLPEQAAETAEWDDTKFRHAYLPFQTKTVALCGYDGPSTWRNESQPPSNLCPICAAILPEYWDGEKWI
jgi:hypothetical protein